jgi:lipopolysaccharide biosynthesis glycosyltransferase
MAQEFLDENLEILIIVYSANVSADVCADVWHLKKKTCQNIVRQDFKEEIISLNFKTWRRKLVKTSNVKNLKKIEKKFL